jgi:hypothetical protein
MSEPLWRPTRRSRRTQAHTPLPCKHLDRRVATFPQRAAHMPDPSTNRCRACEPLDAAKETDSSFRLACRERNDRERRLAAKVLAARDLDVGGLLDEICARAGERCCELRIQDAEASRTGGYHCRQPTIARRCPNPFRRRFHGLEPSAVRPRRFWRTCANGALIRHDLAARSDLFDTRRRRPAPGC